MLRRKKAVAKIVSISFNQEDQKSPYILNLPEKLKPLAPVNSWQPSILDSLLSGPLKKLKPLKAENEPVFKIKTPAFHFNPSWLTAPSFKKHARKKLTWPKIVLPKLKFPTFKLPSWNLRSVQIKIPKIKLPQPQIRKLSTSRQHLLLIPAWHRALAGFAAVAIILILPLKVFSAYYTLKDTEEKVVASGTEAFAHLDLGKLALENGDLTKATSELQESLNIFSQTQVELNAVSPIWRGLLSVTPVIGNKIKNGENLMLAGTNLTLAGLPLVSLFNQTGSDLTLKKIKSLLEEIIPRIEKTNRYLMAVDLNFLPAEKREEFQKTRATISFLNNDLLKVQSLIKNLDLILGADESKTYLVVFQNNNEIRPTGGFIGSYAELRIKDGKIAKFDIPGEGSYKLQGDLKAAVIPPTPLQILKMKWEFQDANWFADFPTSAKKIAWFYEKSSGPTVDGVIALDTQVLLDLLKLAGPITLPGYQKTLTPDNAIKEIQQQVEFDYNKTQNQPKQILSDLAPLLLNKLVTEKANILPLLNIANRSLIQKHLQIYFTDQDLEKEIISQGWGGEIKNNPNNDFLEIVNSNVGGDKTDGVIKQTIYHQTKIETDGSIIDEVTVKRAHSGPNDNPFTDRQNVNFIRFYVPHGSQLLTADGFSWPEENQFHLPEKWYKPDEDLIRLEQNKTIDSRNGTIITEEFGKTVFGNWVLTKPGQETTVVVTYRLPFKLTPPEQTNWQAWLKKIVKEKQNFLTYSLLTQKQPGTLADDFYQTVAWPESWKPLWTDPENLTLQKNQLNFKTTLLEDNFFGLVFENTQK